MALKTIITTGLCVLALLDSSLSSGQNREVISLNPVIANLKQELPAIGTFTRSAQPGLNFAIIDEQYGDFDLAGVESALASMQTGDSGPGLAPIIRTPLANRDSPQAVVEQVLNAGALGIMFPDIETRQQAAVSISAMRLRQNTRGPGPVGSRTPDVGAAAGYWGLTETAYSKRADVWPLAADGELIAMIQIESPTGIANLEQILEVPGIGVVFLGPTDIAAAIDAEGPDAAAVEVLVQEVLKVCIERNIACGYPIVATSPEDAERQTVQRLAEGFKVLAVMTRTQ